MQENSLNSSVNSINTLVTDFISSLTISKNDISIKRLMCFDSVIKSSYKSGVASSSTQFDKIIKNAYNSGVSKITKKRLILELNKMVDDFYR